MKNKRRVLFISILLAALVAISVLCFIIGRGHTVYFDNKSIEGTDYSSYDSIEVYYKDEKIVTLGKMERGSITLTGQELNVRFVAKKTKAASPETFDATVNIPYDFDGIIINIPAYIDGAKEDVYLSEFIVQRVEEEEDVEVPVTDEFGMTSEEE